MRKVLVFGNSGSGKSTLAKTLCDDSALSHLDLDTLAWEVSSPPKRKSLEVSGTSIQNFIDENDDGWVIEGCYTDLLELAVPFANEMIFLNLPIERCISNAKHRLWEPHKYPSKEAQDANLAMLIDWIAQYQQRSDTFSAQAHLSLYESFAGKKVMYVDNERNQ